MNKRRWIAILIALCLIIYSKIIPNDLENNTNDSENLIENIELEGSKNKRIIHLYIDGIISNTEDNKLLNTQNYNHTMFLKQIRKVQNDPSIKGILLEINSPGGGVYESSEIVYELNKIKKAKIPIYVSMTNIAASGAYYISASANRIFATNETLTGSIGVIMKSLNYSSLLEKIGIKDSTYKSGPFKDIGSGIRKENEKDRKVLQNLINNSYNRFIKIVSKGRNMSEDQVKKIADGRIYDGEQAIKNGLVDEIGFPEETLYSLKKTYHLENSEVFSYGISYRGLAKNWLKSMICRVQRNQDFKNIFFSRIMQNISVLNIPKILYY